MDDGSDDDIEQTVADLDDAAEFLIVMDKPNIAIDQFLPAMLLQLVTTLSLRMKIFPNGQAQIFLTRIILRNISTMNKRH